MVSVLGPTQPTHISRGSHGKDNLAIVIPEQISFKVLIIFVIVVSVV
jgi:hypothetical protein